MAGGSVFNYGLDVPAKRICAEGLGGTAVQQFDDPDRGGHASQPFSEGRYLEAESFLIPGVCDSEPRVDGDA
jgi:hypothetical protein